MKLLAPIAFGFAALLPGAAASTQGASKVMVLVPGGNFTPSMKADGDPAKVAVAAFRMDVLPVTNAQYLAFVEANPGWRRSRVSPLFADSSYLGSWAGDLELGRLAPANAPVVQVSWFAARAYAKWVGKRLPTTIEWEYAASVGYSTFDGRNDKELSSDLYAWLGNPAPEVLPEVTTSRANVFGIRGIHALIWEWVEDFNATMPAAESRADGSVDRGLFCAAGAVSARDTGDFAAYMRTALRSSLKANNTTRSLGFRCAADAAPSPLSP